MIMTDILFFTISSAESDSNKVFDQEFSIILPILASSLVIGGKVASFYYKYIKEYAQMLTEALFIFLLFGILSSLYGSTLPSFIDFIPAEQALHIYVTILAYLALISVALEIVKWLLWLKKEENDRKQKELDELNISGSTNENYIQPSRKD